MKGKKLPASEGSRKGWKRPSLLLRALVFLLTVALVVGAVSLVAFRDRLNLDALKRQFTYRSLELSDSGQGKPFSHGGAAADLFASADDGLLTCSSAGVRLYSAGGTKYADKPLSMSSPAAAAAGEWSLAYDVGGTQLVVFQGKEEVFTLALENEERFLSARISSTGYLTTVTQKSGYKCSVLVYGPKFQPLVQLNLSSTFLTDAVVSADRQTLAAVSIGQSGGLFESRLELYRLDRLTPGQEPVPDASCRLGSGLILDIRESAGSFWALGESSVTLVSGQGEALVSYDYAGRYLKEFSLDADGFAAVLLGRYRSGSQAELVVLSAQGAVSTLSCGEQILSLSAAGRYLAVLTAARLDIYTAELTPYNTLEGTQGARKVLMRADGSALLLDAETARLYIPG